MGSSCRDSLISGVVGGVAHKVSSVRNTARGKTTTPQEISANAKTRDLRKVTANEIKKVGKKASGLRRRVDISLKVRHRELLKKYAKSQVVKKSKELVVGQLEYEINTYVIKGHASITGYIKDMLRQFLPIEYSDDLLLSVYRLLEDRITIDENGVEELEICTLEE